MTLPYQTGMLVQNKGSNKSTTITRSEYLTNYTFGPESQPGEISEFPVNPMLPLYKDTVLQNMLRNFQKYRFKKLSLELANTTGTNNGGSLVTSYVSNPDQKTTSLRAIYNSDDSVTGPAWMPRTVAAAIKDPKKEYNVDEDSAEIMQTTQGKFIIGVVTPPTTTGLVSIPIILKYTVEMIGAASQESVKETSILLAPSGEFEGLTGTHGNFVVMTTASPYTYDTQFNKNAGYDPNVPIYELTVPFDLPNPSGGSATVTHFKVRTDITSTTLTVQFYVGLIEAYDERPYVNALGALDASNVAQIVTSENY